MTIKAIIFDLGRVLVDLDTRRGMFKLFNISGDDQDTAVKRLTRNDLFRQFNAGRLSPEEFYQAMREKFGVKVSSEEFAILWCDVFNPMPGMKELLGELNGKFTIGLLSDTDPLHWNFLRQNYPMLQEIERPTLSFEVGVCKPARQIFIAASNNVGQPPEDCLYIDDLAENVEGAKHAGMSAICFKGAESLRKDLADLGLIGSEPV